MNQTLTIVIPAFNESLRITKALSDIDAYITKTNLQKLIQVVVVNDGSVDDTKDVVNNWIQKESQNKNCFSIVSYLPNRGKGYAVREGFLNTSTALVLYTDADGAAPIDEVKKLLAKINDFDIVVGSRVLKDGNSKIEMSFKRRFVGFIFHIILRFLGLADVKDTQCGFKLFKSEVAQKLASNQKCFGFSFDIEYLYLAKQVGYKIKEVPINWYHVAGSKVSLFRDSIKMLIEVLKIRFVYKYN